MDEKNKYKVNMYISKCNVYCLFKIFFIEIKYVLRSWKLCIVCIESRVSIVSNVIIVSIISIESNVCIVRNISIVSDVSIVSNVNIYNNVFI